MLVVIALGGNALLQRGETASAEAQRHNVQTAVRSVAEVARTHTVVVTHGNGPQVGLLALQAAAYAQVPPYPLDVLGAESEGMIGYLLEQELGNHLPGQPVATLLTQTLVQRHDPAFTRPTKDVDGVYTDWGTPGARRLRRANPTHLQAYTFASGSMGPKVEAACHFVSAGGTMAAIAALADAAAILRGDNGTVIVPGADAPCWYPGKSEVHRERTEESP